MYLLRGVSALLEKGRRITIRNRAHVYRKERGKIEYVH